ncbi:ABC transporter permease [Burkholderia aenigmatica]|uniref:ABC transporter permease n=1 Tax=Burkholderia aenigmatica TaxID=2015348 RepID=UPI001F2CAD57|nr:ABC transporter permease [Burkholderia aenigmatica]UKD17119.1 ABC transporter permease [Burkholderia aenigmatica]
MTAARPSRRRAGAARAWPWVRWLARRAAYGALIVLAVTAIVFVATQALPSDPARAVLGPDAPESSVRTLRAQLGLDRPLADQYLSWLAAATQGRFGVSLDSGVPVARLVGERLGNSLLLLALTALVVIPFALVAGTALAVKRDSLADRVALPALVLVKATPEFAIGIVLVMLFATTVFQWLPAVSLLDPAHARLAQLDYLVLPVATLAIASAPYLVRLVRGATIDALDSDYVAAARLRGIPERRILWRHALPNALLPMIHGVALTFGVLAGGSLVVEVVFTYPGLGTALNAAINVRDVPVIQALVLLIATAVVAINLVADLLAVRLTPRRRTAVTDRHARSVPRFPSERTTEGRSR